MNPPTVILRHRKEKLKKCSLRGLEKRDDFLFFSYPLQPLPPLDGYILLKVGSPPITAKEKGRGLFILDGTWELAKKMEKSIPNSFIERSLPEGFKTAYPRYPTKCPNKEVGLASIEAIYVAYHITGKPLEGLLDHYYWKDQFLEMNHKLLL